MKTKNLFTCLGVASPRSRVLPALVAGLGLILAGRVTAQTFSTLHNFTATAPSTNSDGASPHAGLISSGNILYGTANGGGTSGNGTVFAVNTDGTGFMTLHSFTALSGIPTTNSDGANPEAGLILSGNTLYGTSQLGGSYGFGTVFKVNTDGTGFTNLHSFTAIFDPYLTNSDGASPQAGLILSGSTLYGTASAGGSSGNGTVFAVNTDGTGFTTLYSFTATSGSYPGPYINSDGAGPNCALILSSNTLYGTAGGGGSSGNGTVFAVNTDGTGFTNLYTFTATSGFPAYINSDGAFPLAGLILSGDTLFGTARNGGSSGQGTVFKVNTNGTGFTNLHSFAARSRPNYSNSDGALPFAELILSGDTLYGTAYAGGSANQGTVFAVNTDGTGFTNLHSFTGGSDGALPFAGLTLSGNTLYGTARNGSNSGNGTVFNLSFAPQLTIIPTGANVILTWPTSAPGFSYAGYDLQSTVSLATPTVWSTNSPAPVVVNGQFAVTNPIFGPQKFYRLSQ